MAVLTTLNCPGCGARLQVEPGKRILTCDHCGNSLLLEMSSETLPASFKQPEPEWKQVGEYQVFLHEVIDEQIDLQRVIYINVEYANPGSKSPLSCRRNQWLLFDQDNYSYEAVAANKTFYEDRQRPYFGGDRFLNLQMHARGWLAFIVPPTARLKRLHFFTNFLTPDSVDILLNC